MPDLKEVIPILQLGATSLGFGVVCWQLYLEFSWRRRHYAVDMVAEWNKHTRQYRRTIDHLYPGILEQSGPTNRPRLTKEEAALVYDSQPRTKRFAIKHDIIELLNYCEYIAVSAKNRVADKDVLLNSFLETLHLWHHELVFYICIATERRRYNPWTPFNDFMLTHYFHHHECRPCLLAARELARAKKAKKDRTIAFLKEPVDPSW